MAIQTPTGARLAKPRLSDIELCAWIAQAEAGERVAHGQIGSLRKTLRGMCRNTIIT